jgi:hypothetical protein
VEGKKHSTQTYHPNCTSIEPSEMSGNVERLWKATSTPHHLIQRDKNHAANLTVHQFKQQSAEACKL